MAVSTLVVSGIKPELEMLGNEQRFILPELNNYGIFGLKNVFEATIQMPTTTHYQVENSNFSGYRISQITNAGENLGTLFIQYFLNGSYDSIPLMSISPDGVVFNVDVNIPIPPGIATIEYVDNHTWTTSDITDLSSYRLDQFAAPITSLSIGNQKLINVSEPTLDSDAATKYYVDHTAAISPVVTLSGAVSGTGNTGTTISTTLNTTLNNVPAPTASLSLNSQKITSLGTPTLATDGATKGYIDSAISSLPASTVTLSGDVTGSGSTGSPISTTLNKRLDQITAPIASVSLNSQKITNLGTPTANTDAATKLYVDTNNPSSSVVLQGAVSGTGLTGTPITTTLNTTLNNIPIPTAAVSLNSQKITSLATPTVATDGATKGYVDTAIGSIPGGSVTLSGAVSGTGSVGSTISTTLLTTLNNVPIPTSQVNLNSQKIIGLASPTVATDATTKGYVDGAISSIPAATITLAGAVTGSGAAGTSITTNLITKLNAVPAPIASVDFSNQKILNLATPTLATDGTNKTYVDSLVTTNSNISGSANVTVTGTNPKVINLTTTGVTAGNYISPKITVDTYGRITTSMDNYFGLMNQGISKTWNWENFSTASIILDDSMILDIVPGRIESGALFVQQGHNPLSTPPYSITLPIGTFRYGGSTSSTVALSTTNYAIDLLLFRRDFFGQVYLTDIIYNFTGTGLTKQVVNYTGATANITIRESVNNICRIKLLGAAGGMPVSIGAGGGGLYDGWSGAGGFTVYHFDTTSYINQSLSIKVGGGGFGGIMDTRAGNGGYPNGGRGILGALTLNYFAPSGGGGRSEVRIGTNLLAIAGGGGGGSCGGFMNTTSYGGAGGGTLGQSDNDSKSTGGTQIAGGTSSTDGSAYPATFVHATSLSGAGSNIVYTSPGTQNCPGGGDGYYGGGTYWGLNHSASGGSGYVNTGLAGYLSSFFGIPSNTYQGEYNVINYIASSDPDFNTAGLGAGLICTNTSNGATGGHGRVVIEFL